MGHKNSSIFEHFTDFIQLLTNITKVQCLI